MTPESPLDKKDLNVEETLTVDERIGRLEHVLENGYNQLAKYIHETELKLQQESFALQAEISRTLTLMNMSTMQNIVAIRETIKALIAKNVLDAKELDEAITSELTKAIEAQQKIMADSQAEQAEDQSGATPQ